jgi:hypothetical protein
MERYRQRAESGERHPGHVDHTTFDELAPALLKGMYEPLGIGGAVLHLDTTDFARIDYTALLEDIRAALPEL